MTTKSSTSPSLVSDLSEIATPALLIDLPTVERNVRKMAEYVRSHGLDLLPTVTGVPEGTPKAAAKDLPLFY